MTKALDDAMMQGAPSLKVCKKLISYFEDGINRLENGGAEVIILACNTAHICYPFLKPKNAIFLSIISETVEYIQRRQKVLAGQEIIVGILATTTTLETGLYTDAFDQRGISYILPGEASQVALMSAVASILEQGPNSNSKAVISSIVSELRAKGVTDVLLGCTDLPLVYTKEDGNALGVHVIDSMDVLENQALDASYSMK
jgi:aspartate racemase